MSMKYGKSPPGCCCQCDKEKCLSAAKFQLPVEEWKAVFAQPNLLINWGKCINPQLYFVLRLFLFLLWAGMMIFRQIYFVVVEKFAYGYFWIYLTFIGNSVLALYLGLAAVATGLAVFGTTDGADCGTKTLVSITWALASLVPTLTLTITVLYWVLVYTPGDAIPWYTVVMHGGNLLVALLDLLSSKLHIFPQQMYTITLFSLGYVLFTFIYFKAGGTNEAGVPYIYAAVDWTKPTATGRLTGLIILVGIPVLFFVILVVTCFRDVLARLIEGCQQMHKPLTREGPIINGAKRSRVGVAEPDETVRLEEGGK